MKGGCDKALLLILLAEILTNEKERPSTLDGMCFGPWLTGLTSSVSHIYFARLEVLPYHGNYVQYHGTHVSCKLPSNQRNVTRV